jgi:putative ABC transport system permease protein
VNPGFDANGLLTLRMSLPRATYTNPQQVIAFYDQALQRVRAIPGVRDAALTSDFPLGGSNSSTSFAIAGRPAPAPGEGPDVRYRDVVPGYFAAMRIPIRRGREFTGADGATSQHVAMINEAAAKRYFPGTDPLGQQLTFPPDTVTRWTIVGVAANVREWQLRDQPDPGLYFPESQDVSWSMVLAVRASGPIPPGSLLAPVRTSIGALDPDLPLFDVLTTDDLVSGQMALEGVALRLLGLFAVLALTLAAVGLGGVMAYSVEQRTHDIGVRMALGARAGDVVRLVLRQGMVLTAIGVGLGAAGALALSGALRRLLYGVSPFDVTTLMAVALLLGAVALVATWIPARRAAGVDPVIALRSE